MRLPEIDWDAVLSILESVGERSPSLLVAFADLPVAPLFPRAAAGGHADWLVGQGVLEEVVSGGRLRHTAGSRGLRVLLRAARACRVVDAEGERGTIEAIQDYLARNFTGAQRSVALDGQAPRDARERRALLSNLASVHWPRTFLDLGDPGAFDAPLAGRVYGEPMDGAVHERTCLLLGRATEAPLRIPHDVSPSDDPLSARAIAAGIRYFLLFPRLKDGVLELGLLPRVRDDIAGTKAEPPKVVPGGLPTPRAHQVEDAESVFVHACVHPIRVKATGRDVYQRDMDELIAGLSGAPTRITSEARVVSAVNTLVRLGALEHGKTASSRRCLLATSTGHAWLGESSAQRFESFLEGVRVTTPLERLIRLGLTDARDWFEADEAQRLWDGLLGFYRDLPRDGGVPLEALVAHSVRYANPLRGGEMMRSPWREEAWESILDRYLDWLGSLGGLAFARSGETVVVGACAMGDYILGLSDEAPVAEASQARVVVQPNFDIVFLGPSPAAEAALARFSDRGVHGHVGTLFRITPASVMRAGAAGMALEDIEGALAEHADGTPDNVLHEISTWLKRVRRVRATSGIVVECPDTETADRIEAASRGGALSRIGATVLLAADRKAFERAVRSLAAEGIVFDLDLSADPVARKKPARRRRRRW